MRVVAEADGVPAFVAFLSSPNEVMREQVLQALGNMAHASTKNRNLILQQGAVPALLELCMDQADEKTIRAATRTLSKLCRDNHVPHLTISRPALLYLVQLTRSTDADTVADACWALSSVVAPNDCDFYDAIETLIN